MAKVVLRKINDKEYYIGGTILLRDDKGLTEYDLDDIFLNKKEKYITQEIKEFELLGLNDIVVYEPDFIYVNNGYFNNSTNTYVDILIELGNFYNEFSISTRKGPMWIRDATDYLEVDGSLLLQLFSYGYNNSVYAFIHTEDIFNMDYEKILNNEYRLVGYKEIKRILKKKPENLNDLDKNRFMEKYKVKEYGR